MLSKHLAATGADCLRLARDSASPQDALLYYSAAEALGSDGPELWRERHDVLVKLEEPELAYLNARHGPWQDAGAIAALADKLRHVEGEHGRLAETLETLDAIYLMHSGEHRRAVSVAKLIARRDDPPSGLACYIAGISLLHEPGAEAQALTWLNFGERLDCNVKFWPTYNKCALLHRAQLYRAALLLLKPLIRNEGGFESCFQLYSYSLSDLVRTMLGDDPIAPEIVDSMSLFFHEHRELVARLGQAPPAPAGETLGSVADRFVEAAGRGDTVTAGTLVYRHRAPDFDRELIAALRNADQDAAVRSRIVQLLLSIDPNRESYLEFALAHPAAMSATERRLAEFALRWKSHGGTGTGGLPPSKIGYLIASHSLRAVSNAAVYTDDLRLLEFLRATSVAEYVDLRPLAGGTMPPPDGAPYMPIVVATTAAGVAALSFARASEAVLAIAPQLGGAHVAIERRLAERGLTTPPWVELDGWQVAFPRAPTSQPELDPPQEGAEYAAEHIAALLSRLEQASKQSQPFSYVRLSDAETMLLAVGSDIEGETIPRRPASYYADNLGVNPDALSPEALRRFQAELYEHWRSADAMLSHRRTGGSWGPAADRIFRLYPNYQPYFANEVTPDFQVDLLELGTLLGILEDRRVLLVGNAAPRLKECFADRQFLKKFEEIGMPQSPIDVVRAIFVPHHGDLAFRAIEDIWQEIATEAFDVALLSASVTAKILAGRIKKYLGRIALDVGYNMQLLATMSSPVAPADLDTAAKRGYKRALVAFS